MVDEEALKLRVEDRAREKEFKEKTQAGTASSDSQGQMPTPKLFREKTRSMLLQTFTKSTTCKGS